MIDFTFFISARTEDKFSGGLSFIEDIGLDRFNVKVLRSTQMPNGNTVTVRGTDRNLAAFIEYIRS